MDPIWIRIHNTDCNTIFRCREFEALEAASAAGQSQPNVAAAVQESAQELIDKYIRKTPLNWVSTTEKHESKMFTCEVPLGKDLIIPFLNKWPLL